MFVGTCRIFLPVDDSRAPLAGFGASRWLVRYCYWASAMAVCEDGEADKEEAEEGAEGVEEDFGVHEWESLLEMDGCALAQPLVCPSRFDEVPLDIAWASLAYLGTVWEIEDQGRCRGWLEGPTVIGDLGLEA